MSIKKFVLETPLTICLNGANLLFIIKILKNLTYQERLRDWPSDARQPAESVRCQILQSRPALIDKKVSYRMQALEQGLHFLLAFLELFHLCRKAHDYREI